MCGSSGASLSTVVSAPVSPHCPLFATLLHDDSRHPPPAVGSILLSHSLHFRIDFESAYLVYAPWSKLMAFLLELH